MSGGPHTVRIAEEGFLALFKVCICVSYHLGLMVLAQPGKPRSLQETIESVEAQYEVVLSSEAVSRLTDAQRTVGIKDLIAQPFLEYFQARRTTLLTSTTNSPNVSPQQVTELLRAEMERIPSALRMNPLLHMQG